MGSGYRVVCLEILAGIFDENTFFLKRKSSAVKSNGPKRDLRFEKLNKLPSLQTNFLQMCVITKITRLTYSVASFTVLLTHLSTCKQSWCRISNQHTYRVYFLKCLILARNTVILGHFGSKKANFDHFGLFSASKTP